MPVFCQWFQPSKPVDLKTAANPARANGSCRSIAATYRLVEAYPDDKYLPSYLLLARHRSAAFHVFFAADVEGDSVRVITSYRSDPQEWEPDMKTRRRKP